MSTVVNVISNIVDESIKFFYFVVEFCILSGIGEDSVFEISRSEIWSELWHEYSVEVAVQ